MNFKIVERPQLRIVFCLPGTQFSHNFLMSWTSLIQDLPSLGITPIISPAQSPVIYYARNKALGGDVRRGKSQKPFNGQIPYDYLMWIDSDIVFNTQSLMRLLNQKKDIIGGLYMMEGGKNFAAVIDWDENFFVKNGYFPFISESDIVNKTSPFEVGYTGLGFTLVKYGVFESLEYPWFQPVFHDIGDCRDFSSEDVSFCTMIRQKGFKVYVDPTVRVGHEKRAIY